MSADKRPAGVGGKRANSGGKGGGSRGSGGKATAPQGEAAEALPEGAANPPESQDKKGHAERAMTRSVKLFASPGPGRPLTAKDAAVRKTDDGDFLVKADEDGEDQLVELPGPIQVADTARVINGIQLNAGEEFILP